MKHKIFVGKRGTQNQSEIRTSNDKTKKKKWIPQHKRFEGSVGEGHGFAFKRKFKAKHQYVKLLRKEKRKHPAPKNVYRDEYPDHLKHLYLEEKEKLKKEALANRVNRSKERMKDKRDQEPHEADDAPQLDLNIESPSLSGEPQPNPDPTQTAEPNDEEQQISIPMSNRMRKKLLKKTSYQKTKEEFERRKELQKKKQEEYLRNKQQREEAKQRYKQKKMETYQMLCKKTKKGQPNLNLQMEYLLQKIQRTDK